MDKRPSGMFVLGGLFFFVIVLWVRGCDSLLLIFSFHFTLVEP
nr:MAG TPA: Mature oligodendrocyte transmembrane protein [Caudoviricetes sp.]